MSMWLRAGVAVACLTRYQNLIAHGGLIFHGIYYYVPQMLRHFDTAAVIALAAPRALLCMTGDQDFGSPVDGIRVIEKKTRQVYRLYGEQGNFRDIVLPGLDHRYLPEMWERTLSWLDKHLIMSHGQRATSAASRKRVSPDCDSNLIVSRYTAFSPYGDS